jgi:esterase/lipase
MFETVSIGNVNSWISGGSLTGVLVSLTWCRLKIRTQCKTITAMSEAMKKKVEEKEFEELKRNLEKMEEKNSKDHESLFKSSTEQLRILSFLEGKASNSAG